MQDIGITYLTAVCSGGGCVFKQKKRENYGINIIRKLSSSQPLDYCGKTFLLCVLMLLQSCQTLSETDRSSMAMGFAEAAYGVGIEYSGQHPVTFRENIIKWNANVPLQLIIKGESTGSDLYKSIVSELTQLYRLAAIDLKNDGGLSKQLLRVVVKDESLLITEDIKTSCYTAYNYTKGGTLRTVDIVVARSSINNQTDSCLLHEGMHSLGFAGHPHRLKSVLSYTQDLVELTEIDKQLIGMLYSNKLKKAIKLEDALTIAYSQFSTFPERSSKHYVPVGMSLELEEDESPVVFMAPFMAESSKQFFYKIDEAGSLSLQVTYGARSSSNQLANLYYTKLSGELVFKKQTSLGDYVKQHESYSGSLEQKSEGHFDNNIGRFKYIIAESNELACVFIIKYIDASDLDLGGHKLIRGNYCGNASTGMQTKDAESFIGAIHFYDRNPLSIRERKIVSLKNANRNFSAIRLTGKWPLDGSPVSGLKLFVQGRASGKMKITINGEICNATLSGIQTSGLGTWALDCQANENASGQFSREAAGIISFRGQTSVSGGEIDWIAYQIL